MSRIHRIAGLKISRVEPVFSSEKQGKDLLPNLAPVEQPTEESLRLEKSNIFLADSIMLSHDSAIDDVFEPRLREEHNDTIARVTVYVMNMIVMVFAMPVGLALLCFNILFGENLRTTAHVIALTGMGTSLLTSNPGLLTF